MIRNNYIALLSLSLALLSCSNEIGEDPNAPVALNPHIAGVSITTRGGASEDAKNISTLGIYAVNATSGEISYGQAPAGTYCAYKLSNGVASPATEGQPLWLSQETATIFSFHPIKSGVSVTSGGDATTPNPTIPVPQDAIPLMKDNQTGLNLKTFDFADAGNDYMYGVEYKEANTDPNKFLTTQPKANNNHSKAGEAVPGPSVNIGLKHAFAQIKLIFRKGDYVGECKISSITYKRNMQAIATTGGTTMSLKDGTLSGLADATDVTYTCSFASLSYPVPGTTDADVVSYVNYVVPTTTTAGNQSTITITVDGKLMPVTCSEVAWTAGTIYSYTIKINGTGLELTGIRMVPWKEETQGNIPNL